MKGLLVRQIPVQFVDLSSSGCLLETSQQIQPGSTGELQVSLQGTEYHDAAFSFFDNVNFNGYYARTRTPGFEGDDVAPGGSAASPPSVPPRGYETGSREEPLPRPLLMGAGHV